MGTRDLVSRLSLGVTAALAAAYALAGTDTTWHVPSAAAMPFTTLEDFYGETGKRFQAAFGFRSFEPTAGSGSAPNSYGVAVDDMVISWKETRLDTDTHTCAGGGQCADIELRSTLSYDATSLIEITVTDKTPYDTTHNGNDCNGDGDYVDIDDDQDCNDNGTLDVTVKLTSDAEVTGETAILDRIAPGSPVYRARFPYSSTYNSPGTLFVQVSGSSNPVITARYEDRDDGTGSRCKNALDPSQQGFVAATTTIVVIAGRVDLKTYALTLVGAQPTNGDNDAFADARETIDMAVTFTNKSGVSLDDLTASLGTTDPTIECISKPFVTVPALPGVVLNGASATSAPFRFKVANVNRTAVDQTLQANFTLTLRSKQFDALTRTMSITIDLDLSFTGGSGPNAFIEDFEGGPSNFGKFTLQTLDAGKNSLVNSDGMRCQYNDPDALNTNSAGDADCFLGFATDGTAGVNDWHVHTGTASQGGYGRAYTGLASVHWGVHNSNGTPKRDTGRFKQLDAIVTVNPINLPAASANPELVFAHQVSLVDNRGIGGITWGEVADRAIVQVNVFSNGHPTVWSKLQPYENVYEQQGTDDFTNCTFDPTDDGNTEDAFFNPTDPGRRTGPSSTCFPEFAFSRSGDTDYRNAADPTHVGLADANAGLQGSVNVGTWVRPRFSLIPFAAGRIHVRFLGTSIELGTGQTWDNSFFNRDDVVADDGWYIDDIRVDKALGIALTIIVDTKTITPLATCGTCSAISAALTSSPAQAAGPGQLVTLEAKASTIDVCLNGLPQYQFWLDGNSNSVVGDAGDTLMRDYTDNPLLIDAPSQTTRYGVRVRCSSTPTCDSLDGSNATTALVTVPCPSTGNAKALLGQSIGVGKGTLFGVEPDATTTVSWPTSASVDAIRGNLDALKSAAGNFTGTVSACIGNNVAGVALAPDAVDPGAGNAFYYLLRPAVTTHCNETTTSYGTGHVKEAAGRDAELAADPNACP